MKPRTIGVLLLGASILTSVLAKADDDDDDRDEHQRPYNVHRGAEGHSYPSAVRQETRPGGMPGFPRESPKDGAAAKQAQLAILLDELGTEERLLADAQRQPVDAAAVERHRSNIEALRREIMNAAR